MAHAAFVALSLAVPACVNRGPEAGKVFHVLKDGRLGSGLDLGVDSSPRRQGWVRFDTDQGVMVVDYAANAKWGSVTFLLGLDDPAHRLTDNFGKFSALEVEVAGQWGHPHPETCGWSGSGAGFSIVGLSASPVLPDPCNPTAPPRDAHGRDCWIDAPADDSTFRRYRIPLNYLEAGQSLRGSLWSPAQIVFPDNTGGASYSLRVKEISLIPQEGTVSPNDPGEVCPSDCLCLTPACELTCGKRATP